MRITLLLAFLSLAHAAQAAVFSYTDAATTPIPDGDSSGVGRSLLVTTGGQTIVDVEVDLSISASAGSTAYLGDLYVYLTNGTEAAILVNRAGRRTGAASGYSDDVVFNVSISSLAANDIHSYRIPITGSNNTALGGPLTGTWQPDGRMIDPAVVLDTDPRTAGLDIFNGDLADGNWSLFAADLSTGAAHKIDGWTLRINAIPEPSSATLLAGLVLATALRRRSRKG
jgi:subtilisin-like proprotein convertase family protein